MENSVALEAASDMKDLGCDRCGPVFDCWRLRLLEDLDIRDGISVGFCAPLDVDLLLRLDLRSGIGGGSIEPGRGCLAIFNTIWNG